MSALDPNLRAGMVALLSRAIKENAAETEPARAAELARRLEAACVATETPGPDLRQHYIIRCNEVRQALGKPYGECLETTIVALLLEGKMAPSAAATRAVHSAHLEFDPRRVCRARFYEILARDPRFGDSSQAFARKLERGCYNAALERCTASADSYTKQWDCPMFVSVYSGRCGRVAANLDPAGSVAQGIGDPTWALDRLASGAWPPEALGAMTAMELCPQAWAAERAQITRRLNQKVEEKTSSLFACPRCHKRNHTYRQVQIGAGDEPSTFMCTCKECGENYEGFA